MKKHLVTSSNVELSVYMWGQAPSENNPKEIIIFAHGFPDSATIWDGVVDVLKEDYFIVAFDMRGCGDSTPIKGMKHYKYDALVNDLFRVIDDVCHQQKVHLVGHDWGGLYGWEAISSPESEQRIASFTTLAPSLEHVGFFLRRRMLRPTPKNLFQMFGQLGRNSLMMFFAMPVLPELLFYSGFGGFMMKKMVGYYEPDITFRENPEVKYDAIRSLGIYRSNLFQRVLFPQRYLSKIPVHAILAVRDPFLPPSVFEQCSEGTTSYTCSEVDAAHWAPLSRPVELAATIANHVKNNATL